MSVIEMNELRVLSIIWPDSGSVSTVSAAVITSVVII